jgi:hypothetical protein
MTTGMDRVGALMRGELPDRVPVCCNLLEQGAQELGLSVREYYGDGEHVHEISIVAAGTTCARCFARNTAICSVCARQ